VLTGCYLAAGVDVSAGVADGDSTHNLTVAQNTQLASMARYARAYQSIRWERHGLHLTIGTHVERIRTVSHTNAHTEINNYKYTRYYY